MPARRLLKSGLVSLLALSGGLTSRESHSNNLLCAADFSEFDELEGGAQADVATPVPATPDSASGSASASGETTNGIVVEEEDDDLDDEFSASSATASKGASKSSSGSPKRKKRRAAPKQPKSSAAEGTVKGTEGAAAPESEPQGEPEPQSFFYEAIALSGVFAYLTNFFTGKRTNENKAKLLANKCAQVLSQHFYEVGSLSEEDLQAVVEGQFGQVLLTKYSQSEFKMFATNDCVALYVFAPHQMRIAQAPFHCLWRADIICFSRLWCICVENAAATTTLLARM